MSFQTKSAEVLKKARRIDQIADELHQLLGDLEKLDHELFEELKREAGGGARPHYAFWVSIRNTATREISEAVHGGGGWQSLPTVEDILKKSWSQVLPDYAAQDAVEGR